MSESDWTIIGGWLAAGLTLAMYSFLYGDNPVFKIAEHLYVGVSIGYLIVVSAYDYIFKKFWQPLVEDRHYWVLIPAFLGVLVLTRLVPKISWMSRWSFAALMGYAAGLAIPRTVSQFLLAQIEGTVEPVVTQEGFALEQFSNILILVGVVCVLVHFFYSTEHRGPLRWADRVGILFLMVSFGAAFGYTTMARMSLLFGRVDALEQYGRRDYLYASPILAGVIIVLLVIWRRTGHRQPPEPMVPNEA